MDQLRAAKVLGRFDRAVVAPGQAWCLRVRNRSDSVGRQSIGRNRGPDEQIGGCLCDISGEWGARQREGKAAADLSWVGQVRRGIGADGYRIGCKGTPAIGPLDFSFHPVRARAVGGGKNVSLAAEKLRLASRTLRRMCASMRAMLKFVSAT